MRKCGKGIPADEFLLMSEEEINNDPRNGVRLIKEKINVNVYSLQSPGPAWHGINHQRRQHHVFYTGQASLTLPMVQLARTLPSRSQVQPMTARIFTPA